MLLRRIGVFIATCAYVGYAPVAPGTFGSAVGLAVFYGVRHQGTVTVEAATIVVLLAIGLWAATEAEHHFGGIDPGPVVIDEVIGMLITLAFIPVNLAGAIRRILHLPSPRRREAMAGQAARAPARRLWSRARRCDGRHLWQSRDVGPGSSPAGLADMSRSLASLRQPELSARDMKTISRAAIIAVGSELLTPTRVDTNSLFITEQLNLLGIEVAFKSIVGDDRGELEHAVRSAIARVDLLVCCGGLGPTDDDLTRPVVADVLRRPLVEDEAISARIRARFQGRGLEMPEINRRQAMVPVGARVLENANGTAPGLWIEDGERVVLLLPGPPRELKPMMTAVADGPLRQRAAGQPLVRRVIKITGRSESHTEEAVQPLYAEWARAAIPISVTILASLGQIELHLSACCASRADAEAALDEAVERVKAVMGMHVYSTDGRALEEVLGAMLAERALTIGVAESCTGGLIMSRLTDVPGSSRYVERGVVAYSNSVEGRIARRARGADRGARRRQRTGGDGDGGRHQVAVEGGHRHRRHRHRGTRRRHGREARRHRVDCRGVAVGQPRAHVPVCRRPRDGEVPGIAGGARHGPAHAAGAVRLFVAAASGEPPAPPRNFRELQKRPADAAPPRLRWLTVDRIISVHRVSPRRVCAVCLSCWRGVAGSISGQAGSGNLGAANVLRTAGARCAAAVIVMLLDVLKGSAAVLCGAGDHHRHRGAGCGGTRVDPRSHLSACGCDSVAAKAWRLPPACSRCSRRPRWVSPAVVFVITRGDALRLGRIGRGGDCARDRRGRGDRRARPGGGRRRWRSDDHPASGIARTWSASSQAPSASVGLRPLGR